MANRPRPPANVLKTEIAKIEKAVKRRERAERASEEAEMDLRQVICDAFDNGLSASYISEATGLSISRLYQIGRGVRT